MGSKGLKRDLAVSWLKVILMSSRMSFVCFCKYFMRDLLKDHEK